MWEAKWQLMILFHLISASSNQFHKYYQYGEFENCEVYQQDLKNCLLWKTRKSVDALVKRSVFGLMLSWV